MDYRGFVEGVTVYFPVFAPGALFFLGDGHAIQGDGEIVGTGVEISFDAQFTVRVIKNKTIGWPRGENADYRLCRKAPAFKPGDIRRFCIR
jgi:acetamidase/formamidase